MIKNFNDFLNESETNAQIEKSLDAVVLDCIKRFHPRGGNSSNDDQWHQVDPMFDKNDGPDIFLNTSWEHSDKMYDDVEFIASLYAKKQYDDLIAERFAKYGLEVESFHPEEAVLYITKVDKAGHNLSTIAKNKVRDFYLNQKENEKELEEKLKTYLTGKKYGL